MLLSQPFFLTLNIDAPLLDSDDDPLEVFITHSVRFEEMLVEGLKLWTASCSNQNKAGQVFL
jgi:hypothetical protein